MGHEHQDGYAAVEGWLWRAIGGVLDRSGLTQRVASRGDGQLDAGRWWQLAQPRGSAGHDRQ